MIIAVVIAICCKQLQINMKKIRCGAIWPVTGQGFQNTKWPAVLYSEQTSQNRKILANLNYHILI